MGNNTLSRIYASSKNIEGIMSALSVFMDKNGYIELDNKYKELIKEVPNNTILSNEEKNFGNFGVDLKHYGLDSKLRDFEHELSEYNIYKYIFDKKNEIYKKRYEIHKDKKSIDDFVLLNKELIMLIKDGSNLKYSQQFTELFDESFKVLFDSLKLLVIFNDNRLLDYINQYDDLFIRENISSLIRKNSNLALKKGSLDKDYIDFEIINKCANNDTCIVKYLNDVSKFLQDKIKEENDEKEKAEERKKQLEIIERKRKILNIKLLLLKSLIIPSIIVPLGLPTASYFIGKKKSTENYLTKTITSTIDINENNEINKIEEYLKSNTTYVASVTICDKYKKNISGNSYSRICNVYDYDINGLSEDYKLTLDNLDESRLTLKYTYEETSYNVEEKYLYEKQIYVTETYQDKNDTISDNKYITKYLLIGGGLGITSAALGSYLYNNNISYVLDDKNEKIKLELKKLDRGI